MTTSLLNVMLADKVEALLDDESVRHNITDEERAMGREQALSVIHAAIWAYSCRGGDFAACYALDSLFNALKLKTWTFADQTNPT